MRILFIGNKNLQNEAILEILKSERNFEINQFFPVQIEEQAVEPNPHKYAISLVDLTSFPYSPDVSIAMVKKNNLAEHILALHTYTSEQLIAPILNAGADYYFSLNSGASVLLDMIDQLSGFQKLSSHPSAPAK